MSNSKLPKYLFSDIVTKAYFNMSDGMRAYFDSFDHFQAHYLATNGFADWLDTLRDTEWNLFWTHHVARTYVVQGTRSVSEVPMTLVHIARQYNVELPVIGGILTEKYWEDIAYYDLWLQEREHAHQRLQPAAA